MNSSKKQSFIDSIRSWSKKEKIIGVFAIFFVFCITYLIIDEGINGTSGGNNNGADGFNITNYDVVLDVGEDNKVDVTENITVNFFKKDKHGIFRFVPTWLKYTSKDGKTIKRKSNVSQFQVLNEPYVVDVVKKKSRIRIGSATNTVGLGEKTYVIKYTYDMGKDPYKGFDELIFHVFGDYWGTVIRNGSVQVNMPKSIEGYNVNFFTDKYRKNNVNDKVEYVVSGNTLYATYQGNLDRSLTVDIELPEGYFVGGSWNYGWKSFSISMVIFALTAFTIFKWFKYGKDNKERVQTVEFYPPDDLNAAQIGYIYNKMQPSKKLVISLIVQLAGKGYIKIDDLKDKGIQITNLVMKEPAKPKRADDMPIRSIIVKKIKNVEDDLPKAETAMMKYLFRKGATKEIYINVDKFLDVKDSLVNKGYIEIVSDNESAIADEVLKKNEEYNAQMEKYKLEMAKYEAEISKHQSLSKMETIVYDELFVKKNVVIISEHKTLYTAFGYVEKELKNSFTDKVYDAKASEQILGVVIRTLMILLLSLISYRWTEDLDPTLGALYTLSFACIFVNVFFAIIMGRRTEYGELVKTRIDGFRHFLETAEKPQLEALVAENPNYFYNILPYTYVLNISKKWISKFENIPMPVMDMGTFNYGSAFSYHSLYDNVYNPKTISTSSGGSSGCSSCGGGCSSCGGGCSSCGGGGSW